jgi:hypothetical protein
MCPSNYESLKIKTVAHDVLHSTEFVKQSLDTAKRKHNNVSCIRYYYNVFSFHFLHISLNSGVLKYQSHSKSEAPSFSHSVQIEEQFVGDIGKHINEGNTCFMYYFDNCLNRMCVTRKAGGTIDLRN